MIEYIDCIMSRVTRDVAQRRFSFKNPLLLLVMFIQNRYKGHIGRDRYETEIGKSFAVVHLDTRTEK